MGRAVYILQNGSSVKLLERPSLLVYRGSVPLNSVLGHQVAASGLRIQMRAHSYWWQ